MSFPAKRGTRRAAGALALLIMAFLLHGCANRLFFYPTREVYAYPSSLGPGTREVLFASGDGTRLHGWFCPASRDPLGTVVHFHGNAQNLTSHASFVQWLPSRGFNLFVWDYRGYGKSEGSAERAGMLADCQAAMACARAQPEVDPARIVVIGQSLGGALSVALLSLHPQPGVKAAVIDSAFASYRRIVREKIGAMPLLGWFRRPLAAWLVSDELSPLPVVSRLSPMPVAFLHGDADPVVPWTHSRDLAAAAGEYAVLWILPRGSHTEGLLHSEVQDRVVDFFTRALGPP